MEFSQAGSDELLTLWTSTVFNTKLLFYTFKNILHPQPQPGTPLHQKAAPCCHRGSAKLVTPVLSKNPNTSVSALEAQMDYFQPQVT